MRPVKQILKETKANEPTYKGFELEYKDGRRHASNGVHKIISTERKDVKKLITIYMKR